MTLIKTKRKVLTDTVGIVLTILIIVGLASTIKLFHSEISGIRVSLPTLLTDFFYTFCRVWFVTIGSWIMAVLIGGVLKNIEILDSILIHPTNFIRNVSPFAWFPFAIIWFGLGENPVVFILSITLFFPTLLSAREIFADISRDYLDEAKVCGAKGFDLFFRIEIPLVLIPLVNLFRIIWGLGWTTVIAAEMLGTNVGLGYRLLDFRYLLFYKEMLLYMAIMGVAGVTVDFFLKKITTALRAKLY